jgi:glycosyltransferase involved in cell wall biosynthesis
VEKKMNKKLGQERGSGKPIRVAMVGTYSPMQCGIATFGADLRRAIQGDHAAATVDIISVGEPYVMGQSQPPGEVALTISRTTRSDYVGAAEFVNLKQYDVVYIQHEYGIYGGPGGAYLLDFIEVCEAPIVSVLHTITNHPTPIQRIVLDALLARSEKVIVMSETAVTILAQTNRVAEEKVTVIPHGVPTVPESMDDDYRLGTPCDSLLILTFGLLSPDKGIECVIEAMPAILEEDPGAIYAIIGRTHPNVVKIHGEVYRDSLAELSKTRGVERSVKFIDQFMPLDELVCFLAASDVYVTPYVNPHQITSGTLAYAVGAGKAVLSTPYRYAEELLAEGRGLLFPFRDSDSLAESIVGLSRNPEERKAIGERAQAYGEKMRWPEVGRLHRHVLSEVLTSSRTMRTSRITHPNKLAQGSSLPVLNPAHMLQMSDDTGILQHAVSSIPLRTEGYCIDDNARALMVTCYLEQLEDNRPELVVPQARYLAFLLHAENEENGEGWRFRNFMSYQRIWLEQEGSEDAHGRTTWALGTMVHMSKNLDRRRVARDLFLRALPALRRTTSLRTWAYGILGIEEYLSVFPHEIEVRGLMEELAARLAAQLFEHRTGDWPWFEATLSYANARLPQALIIAGRTLHNPTYVEEGLACLEWLRWYQIDESGRFSPPGSAQPSNAKEGKCRFDQQPIEAAASISAYLTAWRATGEPCWLNDAIRTFDWFLGRNTVGLPLYDSKSGGCHDGVQPDRLNQNQGAESTLSCLMALAELRMATEGVSHAVALQERVDA